MGCRGESCRRIYSPRFALLKSEARSNDCRCVLCEPCARQTIPRMVNDTKKPNPRFLRIRGWVINGWRTDLVSHKATLQYLQRWNVSRPGSGWDGVGPLRFVHANGSECEIAFCIHNRHALDLPSGKPSAMRTRRLHMSPCVQLEPLIPVIFWGPYLTNSVSTLILGGISHLDAFSGSYVQT